MDETALGVAGLVALLLLLAIRMQIGMALLFVGFVGIAILNGLPAASAVLASTTFSLSANYTLLIIPLFVLMGNVAGRSGMSRRLFDMAAAWLGSLRGGLASASVLGCAGFAAVSGSSIATAMTIGSVAIPEMGRAGYGPRLSTGAVAAGGTLGILIPPSAGFVVYALLTEESIGRLFLAGILPGLLLTGLFVAVITIAVALSPGIAPRTAPAMPGQRVRTALGAMPLLVVILITIGGIYFGVFTPIEASGIGAFLVSVISLANGSMRLRDFGPVALQSAETTAMLFLIVIGASVFGPFLSFTEIPNALAGAMLDLGLGAHGTLLMILLVYLILGTFLESLAMLVITVPIFFPLILQLGFDPIWFGVIVVIAMEMGMVTPPVGLNVFIVKGIARDVPILEIFRGIFPFWVAMCACILLLVLFPQIALYLPSKMGL